MRALQPDAGPGHSPSSSSSHFSGSVQMVPTAAAVNACTVRPTTLAGTPCLDNYINVDTRVLSDAAVDDSALGSSDLLVSALGNGRVSTRLPKPQNSHAQVLLGPRHKWVTHGRRLPSALHRAHRRYAGVCCAPSRAHRPRCSTEPCQVRLA